MDTTPQAAAAPGRKCWCVIAHPVTPEEHTEVQEAIGYARRVGDAQGLLLLLARIAGPCPARA